MHTLNWSVFHNFQWLQLLSGRGMQLPGTAGSWRGTPHPRGCGMPCPPLPCHDTHSCSQQLPAMGLSEAQSEARAAGTTFPWKMWICVVRHTQQEYQWSQADSSVPGFLPVLRPTVWSCPVSPVCPVYQDGSGPEGLGALRVSQSW